MVTTLPTYDPTLFQGAAWYNARYRSKYPQALFDLLADIFKLDGKGRLLDLGCGPGLIAIPFANCFAEVVGLDPDADMLKTAHEEILLPSPFSHLANYEVKFKKSWTIDSYLGYIYSTAFGLPSFFGENREKFETDFRASILAVEPSGEFTEELPVTALVAKRQT